MVETRESVRAWLLVAIVLVALPAGGCDVNRERPGSPSTSSAVATTTRPVATTPGSGPLPTTAPVDVPIPASLALSPEARDALQSLARASHFGGWAVGAAGTPTPVVSAWRVLHALPQASDAFAVVLEHGTLAGQLMALAGLYTTDPARFAREIPRYRGMREPVRVMTSGCDPSGESMAAADVVESAQAVRLSGPNDTLPAWSRRHPGEPLSGFDIVGGGFPAVMKPYRPEPAAAAPSAGSSP